MNLSKIAVKRPVTTTMLVLIVIAFGVLSIFNLKLDLMPNMNIPVAVVSTSYSGVGSEEIEKLITAPIEGVLGTVSGVKEIQSMSSVGSSLVILQFENNVNIDNAALDMREKIDMIKGTLPSDANDPMVLKMDINSFTSLQLGITSEKMDVVDLKRTVDDKIVNRLERQEGVASVTVTGGREKEITLTLNEEKLRGYGISEASISQLLMSENRNTPTGSVKQGVQRLQLRVAGEFQNIEEIKDLPVTTATGAIVYLRDICEVEETYKENSTLSYINGVPSVNIVVQKQSTGNTVSVSNLVLKEMARIQNEMPDLKVSVLLDPAEYINSSLSTVASSAYMGGILAVLVLFVFLRNFRSTLVVASAMPISIIATFTLMYYANITLNIMSLGGFTLGIGMLVDNSIVVLESIYRKIEEGENKVSAAIDGAREVAMSVTASTLTTIAVFLPITFSGGITAQIFNELALTISFSLISSLVIALTFVPMACSVFLKLENIGLSKRSMVSKFYNMIGSALKFVEDSYRKLLVGALKRKKLTVLITTVFVIATLATLPLIGMEFMPATDEGTVVVSISMPHGTLLEETHITADRVIEKVTQIEEVKDIILNVGGGGGIDGGLSLSAGDSANITVNLVEKAARTRSSADVAIALSKMLEDIPGAEISVSAVGSSMGNYSNSGIQLDIKGDDTATLSEISFDVQKLVAGIEGVREVKSSVEDATPQATIRINRAKASTYGISAASVATIVNTAVSGSVATTYKIDGNVYDIRIRQDKNNFDYITEIESILIPSPTGISVPLYELADIQIENMPQTISRTNQQKYVSVTGQLEGRDSNSVARDISAVMESYILPPNYSWELAGSQQQLDESFGSLIMALLLAIVIVYMIMAAEFESLIYPLIIMFSIPIALTGGIFGLFVMGMSLDITGLLGMIMLAGVVINNAIVLIDYTNLLIRERKMGLKDALILAGTTRLRPILMTTLTTVLGLLPMMLAVEEGGELMRGLATVVIFGLSLSTLVTLILIPAVYLIFNRIKEIFNNKFIKKALI